VSIQKEDIFLSETSHGILHPSVLLLLFFSGITGVCGSLSFITLFSLLAKRGE